MVSEKIEGLNRAKEELYEVTFRERFLWQKIRNWNPRQGLSREALKEEIIPLWSREYDLKYEISRLKGDIDHGEYRGE